MDAWLRKVSDALGAGDLSDADAGALLKIAKLAAHESDERTNAPLLCFLVGRAQAGRPLDEILDTVRDVGASAE